MLFLYLYRVRLTLLVIDISLICKVTISCNLTKHKLWGIRKKEIRISANSYQSSIEEAYLGNSPKPDYKVILTADGEKIKISNFSGISNNSHRILWEKQSKQINDFMAEDELDSLTVGENNVDTIFTIILLIIFILIISLIVQILKINISLTLSKESNTLSTRKYNYFTEEIQKVSFEEIDEVILEKSDGIDDITSRIVFRLRSGKKKPLTSWLNSFEKESVFKRVSKFLKTN